MTQNDYETYETRAREQRLPIPYEIFKGMGGNQGVLSIELREAYTNDPTKSDKTAGVVFLNMTPTIGKNQYGWKQKISFALGLTDLGKVLLYLRSPSNSMFMNDKGEASCSIIHDRGVNTGKQRGADVKYLNIIKPADKRNYFFNLTEKRNGDTFSKVSVSIAPDEALIMINLLEAAIPAILSWSPPIKPFNL